MNPSATDDAVRCAIDTVDIARIGRLLRETPAEALIDFVASSEVADAGGGPGRAASLAARFAAKEACLKLFPRETGLAQIVPADFTVDKDCFGAPVVLPSANARAAMDRHRIADISLSLTHSATSASAVALALPRETRVPRIGRLLWKYAPFRRDVIVENLLRVFGAHLPGVEIEMLAQAHYAHLAKLAGEFLSYPWTSARRKRELVRFEGVEHFTKAWEAKGGILVLTGHFGNCEIAALAGLARFPSARGRIHLARRPIKSRWLDALVNLCMHRAGFGTICNRDSLDEILALLAKGDAIVVPFDQFTQRPDGIEVEFFGHLAGTFKGLAVVALSTGAAVLPAATWRERAGTHVLRFEAALPAVHCADADDEIRRTTRAYNAAIEKFVLRHPEQWWWGHRRWKA